VFLTFVENLIIAKMKGKVKITIRGLLDKKWKDCFEGMAIKYEGDNTCITGNIKDEAHLHGLLNQIRDLNLKLISVNPDETDN
jgi:hypothetical protein